MPDELFQIITLAKKLHAKNENLQAGIARRDADLRELREALANERRRSRSLVFSFGVTWVLFLVAAATMTILMLHRP